MAEKALKPTEEKLKPKLFSVMKTYTKEQFIKDIIAGIIVAIIALPLSIALALASGVGPEQGLYTAIIAGFIVSFLGGSRVQIAGPTAAFATTVAGIVAAEGWTVWLYPLSWQALSSSSWVFAASELSSSISPELSPRDLPSVSP